MARELYSHKTSLLHQADARVKVLLTLAIIIFLNFTPPGAWPAYILFLTAITVLILLSRLGLKFVLARTFIAIPFMLAALPIVFICSEPRTTLALGGNLSIAVCPQGVVRFASITIKTLLSVAAAVLLMAVTRFDDLLVAFRRLKVPRLFVAIIGLMWRYLSVIGDEAVSLMRARACRSASAPVLLASGGSLWWRAKVTGGMVGSLLLRSLERSDRVYAAMLSRGYSGEPPGSGPAPLTKTDLTFLLLGVFICLALWLLGVLTGG